MQMLSRRFNGKSLKSLISSGGMWLLYASLLAGCASKNPLMEEPAPAVGSVAPDVAPSPFPSPVGAAQNSVDTNIPATAAATTPATGVQTAKQRRWLGFLSPYRPDIQQGNFVSQEMVSQLKEGMTPDQVRFVLGTPLLQDIFHANRWDYPFRILKGNGDIISSRVTVYFDDNRLARVEGGNLPSEVDFLKMIIGKAPPAKQASAKAPTAAAPTAATESQ